MVDWVGVACLTSITDPITWVPQPGGRHPLPPRQGIWRTKSTIVSPNRDDLPVYQQHTPTSARLIIISSSRSCSALYSLSLLEYSGREEGYPRWICISCVYTHTHTDISDSILLHTSWTINTITSSGSCTNLVCQHGCQFII